MSRNDERSGADFLLGALIGLGCGVGLGLLLAPAPGRDSRAWILARGRAVRQRTAALLAQHDTAGIIRRRGVLGLAEILQRGRRASTDTDVIS